MQIDQLTFLRFVAASGVVIFHFGRRVKSLEWADSLWSRANTAVSFFFLLSGFILAHVYGQAGVRRRADFYVARVARIVPLYWLALVAVTLYRWRKGTLNAYEFAASALLVQAWLPGWSQVLNGPGWSLSVEVLFYLCFPFLLGRIAGLGSPTLVVLASTLWATNLAAHIVLSHVCATGGHPQLQDFAAYSPPMHLATFVFGLVLGLLFEQQRERIRPFAGLMMLIAVVVFLALILIPNSIVKYHHNGLFAPIFGLFVVGLASAPHLQISRIFSRRPFVLLGEASYGIYILQVPLYLGYAPVAQRLSMSPGFHFWSYYAALVLASLASFQWIERPARKRIRSYYQSRLQKNPV